MTAPPRLVIFDCDGVLIDSEVIANRILAECLFADGFGASLDEVMGIGLGKNEKSLRLAIEAEFGRKLPGDFMTAMRTAVMQAFTAELRAIVGIEQVVAGLRIPFCVASNSHIDRVRHALRVTGLLDFFGDRIFTAGMVAHGKPAPDLFLFAAAQCGVPPAQCLVIEDGLGGVAAAKAAGIEVVGFCGGSHCPAGHREALLAAGCSRVFDRAAEIGEFLGEVRQMRVAPQPPCHPRESGGPEAGEEAGCPGFPLRGNDDVKIETGLRAAREDEA
ncbi:MAG TPA: HAD-IA family hydrolase [Stellaceae bacterium]|nr:HAD-IA family hydrolase [Stellaceae bacterium]